MITSPVNRYNPKIPMSECLDYMNDQLLANVFSFVRAYEFEKKYGIPDMMFIKNVPYYDFQSVRFDEETFRQKEFIINEFKQSPYYQQNLEEVLLAMSREQELLCEMEEKNT